MAQLSYDHVYNKIRLSEAIGSSLLYFNCNLLDFTPSYFKSTVKKDVEHKLDSNPHIFSPNFLSFEISLIYTTAASRLFQD